MNAPTISGASRTEWAHFDLALGLGADLLPCVPGVPGIEVAAGSGLTGKLGKIPSQFNGEGRAHGITGWPVKVVTPEELTRWAADGRYNICVRTGKGSGLCAIDIDIEDAAQVAAIRATVEGVAGPCAVRTRANSQKCLIPLRVAGEHRKRVIPTAGGRIEILGDGQQFVAAGVHPSGVRYTWGAELPLDYPTVTPEQFTALVEALQSQFGVEPAPTAARAASGEPAQPPLNTLSAEQEADLRAALSHPAMLESLGDNDAWAAAGYALLSLGAKGFELFAEISKRAPNFEEGAPEAWWSAHASAVPQSDYRAIFARAAELGWQNPATARTASPEAFPAVPAAPAADAPASAEIPAVTRLWQQLQTGAKGVILGNLLNARLVLEFLDKPQVTFDEFDRKIYVRWADEPDRRPLQDADVLRVQIALQKFDLRSVSAQTARDAIALCAEQRRTDRLKDWLNSLVWDGTRRLSRVMPRGFGTSASRYYLRAGRNLFLSMVARGLKPGCQVDEALVLEGPQGSLKSSVLRVIGGEFFQELTADPRSKDFEQQLTGVWLGEFSELNALRRVEDIARIKQFVTNRTDHYRPPYKRDLVQLPRRTVLCGSTNECEWLHDPTGGRRFIPIEVGRIDLTWLQTNREQLFAEAVALVKAGRKWWIYPRVETAEKQEERAPEDPWTERIRDYLYGRSEIVDVAKLLTDVVRMPVERQNKAALTRVGVILRHLGCTQRSRRRIAGRRARPWIIPDGLATAQQLVPDAPGFWPVGSAPNSNSSVHAAGSLA